MSATIKNILIFGGLGIVLILVYVFLIKKDPDQASLISTGNSITPISADTSENDSIAKDFLTILLNVKSIKLDDAIFSDPAFNALSDSSISLTPDGTEGRSNPFAPIGSDVVATPPAESLAPSSTPITPAPKSTNKTTPDLN